MPTSTRRLRTGRLEARASLRSTPDAVKETCHGSHDQGLRIGHRRARNHRQDARRRRPHAREVAGAVRARRAALALLPSTLEEAERRIEILNERGEIKPAPAVARPGETTSADAAVTRPPTISAPGSTRGAPTWTRRSSATCRRRRACPPRRRRGDALQPDRRRQAAAADAGARGRRSGRRRATAPTPTMAARARAAGRLRARADSHLLADPRRPAGDGQRHAAPRPADAHVVFGEGMAILAGDGAADRSVRAAGARARATIPALAARKLRAIGSSPTPPGLRHGRRPGDRSRRGGAPDRAARCRRRCATCTRARPAR